MVPTLEYVAARRIQMAQFKHFVIETTSDLRSGRHSWRVMSALWSAALLISVTTAVFHH